ncbi:MAG TPA: hypothetical protein VMZ06_03360 [Candidatus Bathyarchaeia archaeon]|nr:hypothetical protein [Candidatus Bathyarchaeia archaeon]
MFTAGFAAKCITPRIGQEVPGLFARRWSTGIYDDLYARAAVIDDGTNCVALVQTDAIALPERLVMRARRLAARRCGIPGRNCLIAATHTHSGGPVFGGFLSEPDEDYVTFVADRIGAAIAEAHHARRPALPGIGSAAAPGLAFNRRFIMKDGSQQTHPGKVNPNMLEPAGPADPAVTVAGFCDASNFRPFGCVVHFACHGTHMNGTEYSADYAHWIVDTLEAVYGASFGVVCLNGACGDVTQVDNGSRRPLEVGPYWCERTGRGVGGAALHALARLDYYAAATVGAGSVQAPVSVRTSRPAERKAARALLKKKAVTAKDVETIYARELLEVETMRREKPVRRLEIMGVRMADAFFWGVPAELFQAFAVDVQSGSPFRHTCCVELANGYNGYVCTPEAFGGGGYEVRTARSSFLEPHAGARVVAGAKRLAARMFAGAENDVGRLEKTWPQFADDEVLDGIGQLRRNS